MLDEFQWPRASWQHKIEGGVPERVGCCVADCTVNLENPSFLGKATHDCSIDVAKKSLYIVKIIVGEGGGLLMKIWGGD